jgi:putative flippase GtrA
VSDPSIAGHSSMKHTRNWRELGRPTFEFAHVTFFNGATLGAGLFLLGSVANVSSRSVVIAGAHCESALLSYLYCSLVVWAQPSDRPSRRLARATVFFGLAFVSALASLFVSEVDGTGGTRSVGFVLTNYGAVGVITIAKFVVQRWAMTTRRSLAPRGLRGRPAVAAYHSAPEEPA